MNKKTFETVDVDGNKINLAVVRPKSNVLVDAKRVYSRVKTRLLQNKEAIPRARVRELAIETGLWSDEKQKELTTLESEIDRLEYIIRHGTSTKLNDEEKDLLDSVGGKLFARHIGIKLKKNRFQRIFILLTLSELDDIVAENIADSEMNDYLTAHCTVWGKNDGKENLVNSKYFESYDDYIARKEEVATQTAYQEFKDLYNESDPDWQKKLPENQLLLKYKFVNDNFQLINDKGELVNEQWERVNEEGDLLDQTSNDESHTIADFD